MANLDNQDAVPVWGWKEILLEEEYSSRYMVDIIVIQYIKVFYLLCFESKKKSEISPWIYFWVMRSEYRKKLSAASTKMQNPCTVKWMNHDVLKYCTDIN